jgi:subtilisin family serine protease
MRRTIPIAVALAALALAACEQTPSAPLAGGVPAATPTESRAMPVVGEGVVEALRGGGARVVVALNLPTAARESGRVDLEQLRRAVAAAQAAALAAVDTDGFRIVHRFEAVPALAGIVRDEATLRRLAASAAVRRIDLEVGGTGTLGTSVAQIRANLRQGLENTGSGVVIAVLDSGTDNANPDLAGRITHEACFGWNPNTSGFCPNGTSRQTGPGAAQDDAGHGTHVAGIAAGGGAVTAPGVATGAGIASLKVLDNCSFAGCFYAFTEIVAALDHIIVNNATLGVRVINMSLGTGATFTGVCDAATSWTMAGSAAINTLWSMGVVAFASSGNNGSGTAMPAPACLENVVSVGAVNSLDAVAGFSNSNAFTDIFAPGVSIRSLRIGGGTVAASGTSMASPHAAGCAAQLIQAGDATTPAAILTRLRTSPIQVTDPKNGRVFPRIDCVPAPTACTARRLDRVWSTTSTPGTVRLGDPEIFAATFDVESFLPRAAPASAVRLGGNWGLGTPGAGVSLQDLNNDGQRDAVVRWSMPSLISGGWLASGTQSVRVWGVDPDSGELFCATTPITVVP